MQLRRGRRKKTYLNQLMAIYMGTHRYHKHAEETREGVNRIVSYDNLLLQFDRVRSGS